MTRVLMIGDYRQALTIARSLRARGDRVLAAVRPGPESYLRWSNAVDERWSFEIDPLDGHLVDALDHVITSARPDVIFPVGDLETDWFAQHRDRWGLAIASPDPHTVLLCQDKPALLELATELGVPHAASTVVGDLSELAAAADRLGDRVVVKSNDPLQRVLGHKALVGAPREILTELDAWPRGHDTLIVQRHVDGLRHNLYFAAERGEVAGLVEVEILRTDTVDGTGYAVDGVTVPPQPDLVAATQAIVADLKYHGVGCTQFLVGSDGSTSFLELNPRLGANYLVADRVGLRLGQNAVDLALDRSISVRIESSPVRYAWTTGDLDGLKTAISRGSIDPGGVIRWLGRALRSAWAADVHVTWRWSDPMPTLATVWRWLVRPAVEAIRAPFRR